MNKTQMFFISLCLGIASINSRAAVADPSFTDIRGLFQAARPPQPTQPGQDDLNTTLSWNCTSVYYDPQKAGFTGAFFDFLTCFDNNDCYYKNDAQYLPAWFP